MISLLFFINFLSYLTNLKYVCGRQRGEWNTVTQDAPISVWLQSEEHCVSCMVMYDVSVFVSSHSNGRSQNPSGVFVHCITLVIIWGKSHLIVLNCSRNKTFVAFGEQLRGNTHGTPMLLSSTIRACGPLNPLFHPPSQVDKDKKGC